MIDSIIFDLDGTIWDSSEGVTDSWNKVLRDDNIDRVISKQELMGCMGLLMEDIADKLFPDIDESVRYELLRKCCEYENEYIGSVGGVLFPGVEDTLKRLSKKYSLSIVSNCQSGYIESFFKAHGLEKYFSDYENPGRTGLPKADNIKIVIDRSNLKNAIYVGDTMGDYNSAKKAGVPFIFAKYGFGNVDTPDYVADTFADILRIVDGL